jgi:hypothetical protein
MKVEVKVAQSFYTEDQFVEVSSNSLGGLVLKICEEENEVRLYLNKDQALALAKMLVEVSNA